MRAAKLADYSLEVQAAESRIRSLQASLSRKDDTIREMKERTEQAVRYNYFPLCLESCTVIPCTTMSFTRVQGINLTCTAKCPSRSLHPS